MYRRFNEGDRQTLKRANYQLKELESYLSVRKAHSARDIYAAIEQTDGEYAFIIGHNEHGSLQVPGGEKMSITDLRCEFKINLDKVKSR